MSAERDQPKTRRRKAWHCNMSDLDGSFVVYAPTAKKAIHRAYTEMTECHEAPNFLLIRVKRAEKLDVALPPAHRLVADLTEKQRSIVRHAYGLTEHHDGGYRGYFCTAPGDLNLLRLAWELGLFRGPAGEKEYGRTPGWAGGFFYLTDLGKEVAQSMTPTYRGEPFND